MFVKIFCIILAGSRNTLNLHIVIWVMIPCSDVVVYTCFWGPEDRGNVAIKNIGTLPHDYMVS